MTKWMLFNDVLLYKIQRICLISVSTRIVEILTNAVRPLAYRAPGEEPRRPLPSVPTIQPTKPITIYPGSRAPESEFVLLRAERIEQIYNNKELLVAQPVIGILDCRGRQSFIDRLEVNLGESWTDE